MTNDLEPSGPLPDLEPIGFDGVAGYLANNTEQAQQDLLDYYATYTGRFFEYFSDQGAPDRFDANDLAACASLSAPVDGRSLNALWSRIDALNTKLAACPDRTVTLADIDPSSDGYVALSKLYDTIRDLPDMGKVRTSKLLASKRPALVPIRDSYVEKILGADKQEQWWGPWRELVLHPDIPSLVDQATPAGSRAASATLLRRLDVILWKEAERRAKRTSAQ